LISLAYLLAASHWHTASRSIELDYFRVSMVIHLYTITHKHNSMRIDLNLKPETIQQIREQSLKRYGNFRSMSRYIEDLLTAANSKEEPKPDFEAIKQAREDYQENLTPEKVEVYKIYGESCPKCAGIRLNYDCLKCGASFETLEIDALFCPRCREPNPKYHSFGK